MNFIGIPDICVVCSSFCLLTNSFDVYCNYEIDASEAISANCEHMNVTFNRNVL
jgi:hypothetical protein